MIRAAFFDIDGTLVSFRTHDIPESAVRALELLRECGVLLFLATGRSSADMPRPIRALNERLPFDGFLTFNGQYCYDAAGEVFRDQPIDPADVARIVSLAERGVIDIAVMQRSRMFVNRHTPRVLAAEAAVDNVTPVGELSWALEEPTYQFCAYVEPGEEHLFMDVCENVEHTRWTSNFCDVIPAGGGKPAGIAAACARWGLTPQECVAFGDGGNDVPMFGCVGTSVAMGNAGEDVKAAATMVTSDVDEDGVLVACESLGLCVGMRARVLLAESRARASRRA